MPTDPLATLRWLVAPMSAEQFIAEYWEQKALVIHRKDPAYYHSLLSLEAVDRVVTTQQFLHPDIVLTNAAREVRTQEYTFTNGQVDQLRLLKLFHEGGTIILNQLERAMPSLLQFCRALESELSHRMQANVYLTPPAAQGFKTHYDSHDVFVLQVHGSKQWLLYDTPIELPMRGQPFDPEEFKPGASTQEFTLHAGDLVYVPRGIMHDARSTEEASLHITAGVLSTTWSEALLEAVARVAVKDVAFRRSLPVGFARSGADRTHAHATLRELLQKVLEQLDAPAVLDHFAGDLISTRIALLEGQLTQLLRASELSMDTRMSARPNLLYELREADDSVTLFCHGTELKMPAFTSSALRFALENTKYTAQDLPGELDEAGRLVLLKRLLREGLVRMD